MGRLGDGGTRLRAEALQRAGTEKNIDRGWGDEETRRKRLIGRRGDKRRTVSVSRCHAMTVVYFNLKDASNNYQFVTPAQAGVQCR
jgi:hypothetical protein